MRVRSEVTVHRLDTHWPSSPVDISIHFHRTMTDSNIFFLSQENCFGFGYLADIQIK